MERPDLSTKINLRPPGFYGRDEMETLMASQDHLDWLKITERLLPIQTAPGQADPLKHWKPSSVSNAWRKNDGGAGSAESEAIQG
jgi:tRNA-dihydrouridine synthase 3